MVRKRMSDITDARRPIFSRTADHLGDPIDADAVSLSDVDCAAIRYSRIHGEQICAHNIAHMRKIPRLLSVAVYR